MTSPLLGTFNRFVGRDDTAEEAAAYVAALEIEPMPDACPPDQWKAHVPLNLLENWGTLSDDERVALFVMALSATHAYEAFEPEPPSFN